MRRLNLPALALTLFASGSVALGARCLSPGVARCSWEALTGHAPKLDVPYLGTRPEVVARMLDMAQVGPGDRVLDLGTGDGRILIAAARRGANGFGIDIDPVLIAEAQAAAARADVADRTRFVAQDLFATPLRGHTVVTMFLLPAVNLRLRPHLLADLAPGTRIVSHAFDMGNWPPDATARVGGSHLYLWRVPAQVAGTWTLNDGRRLVLHQHFQDVAGTLDGTPMTDTHLDGAGLRFTADDRRYTGQVDGDTIKGPDWQARRTLR
ncbi:methyltransferase domain-containing protein [Sphingomonas sp. KR1UV-12]|uniref:Methyltransferase domain-containing protein n=1 Tax=Sphingomonas aurea TaxID=3063994 RepID=A0ABT9EI24_9SPHN|nr:methyltransferase domain-containing protein [Sphingomonas sp. KR1UV-12]MDP1026569.1 methyltransferase domain-containing protein [Sphingomonas sp. KR1UV-12]